MHESVEVLSLLESRRLVWIELTLIIKGGQR
jgi:hypothetical protein